MSTHAPNQGQTQRAYYEQKYNTSRLNLLLVVLFTAINLILLVANADRYFLFSAFIPYYIAMWGMVLCGRMPDGFYSDPFYADVEFFDDSVFFVLLAVAAILTLLYLLAWFMSSKNRVGWLIFALVFFIIDTLGMFAVSGIALDSIIDILFHAWVIYYLVLGISAHSKLKSLPVSDVATAPVPTVAFNEGGDSQAPALTDSAVLRDADMAVKHRVFLQVQVLNCDICYRRVKRVNELVINGKVYDELNAFHEHPHTLSARVNGHNISAIYNGAYSFITVDGQIVAKKIRWY